MMKLQNLLCAMCALALLPLVANAEIYKWKDKDGVMRYADTPPPPNVKLEGIAGRKFIKQTGKAPLSPVVNADVVTKGVPPDSAALGKESAAGGNATEDTAAKIRQKNAETEKNNKKEKEAQAKLKEENCKAAKANLASFQQGGRVYKMNEKGEREYLDDAGLKAGAEKAQKEVAEYCNG